jgi:hypothetical protein
MRPARIVYLHGFRSTPNSAKARQLHAALQARAPAVAWVCPQLPASPAQAVAVAAAAVDAACGGPVAVVGSSLGGYYATWLAERTQGTDTRTVLLNPAVRPYEDLRAHLGRQAVYGTSDDIDMRPEYLDELLAIDTPRPSRPARYLLVAATGDEVIDWGTMAAKYAGCRQRIVPGADHALSDFAPLIDEVLDFCGVA